MKNLVKILLPLILISFFAGCSDNDDSTKGRLTVQITDAPFPTDLVAEANVTIDKVEIRKKENSESDESPFIVLTEEIFSLNLLELTNGITESLADVEIEIGSYDLIRLHIADAGLVLKDGTEYDLFVPSGDQTGIKVFINPSIEVAGGLTSELLIDFDVSRSFVVQGNPNNPTQINGFIFKPTIKATNLSTSGRLSGTVTDETELPADGAVVSVFAADTLNTSSITDLNGEYTILGLEAGIYDITVEYGEYMPVTVEEIEIVAGNETTQDVQLTE